MRVPGANHPFAHQAIRDVAGFICGRCGSTSAKSLIDGEREFCHTAPARNRWSSTATASVPLSSWQPLLDEHCPLALDSGDTDVDLADFDPDCEKQIVQNPVKGLCHGSQRFHQCVFYEIR
jgi:hypothetical protein